MASKRPVVLAITSDHHCGSTLGLCPPEGVRIDEGAEYRPHKAQLWSWSCWEEYWRDVAVVRRQHSAELWCAYNGDAVDGDHHNTSQIISRNPEPQSYLLERVFSVPGDLRPERQAAMRGTEVHVGPAGSTEETWSKKLVNHIRTPTKMHSWWHWRPEIHGVLFDFKHHGRVGGRPWTRSSAIAQLAAHIFFEHAENGERAPDFAIRSHCHTYGDSFDACPTRVIQTPPWQLKTAHGHKAVPEAITKIGGIIITVFPDGTTDVQKKLYRPDLPPIWKAA